MRGVALAAKEAGNAVTGTDSGAKPPGTDWLDQHGIRWWNTPHPAHLEGVSRVIVSGHVMPDDPEVVAAQERGLPIESFAEYVGTLTREAHTIVVSGTHGKTTTTTLLAWIFEQAGRNPDYLASIAPRGLDSAVRLTGSAYAILEGDEYRASQLEKSSKFAYYHPDSLIITAVEMDHPDFFQDLDDVKDRFVDLLAGMPNDGQIYYSPQVDPALIEEHQSRAYPYAAPIGWHAEDIAYAPHGLEYDLYFESRQHGRITVPLYGDHNVENTLAAAAVSLDEGITFEQLATAMQSFAGAGRRFERISAPDAAVTVIDDYAHHPTEVATTVAAAKKHFNGRVIAVFQPHTYSRTKELLNEYTTAFRDADVAFIAEIEGAREKHLAVTVSAEDVAQVSGATALTDRVALADAVVTAVKPGDTVLVMTVGGHEKLAQELAERLRDMQ